jgi:hypothetical protein
MYPLHCGGDRIGRPYGYLPVIDNQNSKVSPMFARGMKVSNAFSSP